MRVSQLPVRWAKLQPLIPLAAIFAISLLAYGPILGSFFNQVDDPGLLVSAASGEPHSVHFRPMHFWWSSLLYSMFGAHPFPFYLTSLLLHVVNSLLVVALVRTLTDRR